MTQYDFILWFFVSQLRKPPAVALSPALGLSPSLLRHHRIAAPGMRRFPRSCAGRADGGWLDLGLACRRNRRMQNIFEILK